MTCQVCGSPQSESHFGGISCRACAAFFRRYFNSKKFIIRCICKTKNANSHPCRSCRVEKCLAIGMTPQKVCGPRDPNGAVIRKVSPLNDNHCSLLNTYISLKDTTNITSTISNFSEYEKKRGEYFKKLGSQNIFEVTSLTRKDIDITCEFVTNVFPEFQLLVINDKRAMLNNFMLKLWQIDEVFGYVANRNKYQKMEEENIRNVMCQFYKGSFMEGAEMSKDDLWRIFGSYWKCFFEKLIEPICDLALDQVELMAIIWILFFDHAYINISERSSEMCWKLRKEILRELNNYLKEKFFDEEEKVEYRFLQILDVPLIVERAEQKFLEEFMLCELNKIRIHDDCIAIFKKQRI